MSLLGKPLDFEESLSAELGISPSKKRRKARRAKIKKALKKGVKAVATGGLSLVASAIKGKSTPKLKKAITKVKPILKQKKSAKSVIKKIKNKKISNCTCKDDMAKLVASKIVATLGPPLNEANQILNKFELQRQATYEHKKLMSDSDFRRKVLEHIANKAVHGNKACERTIRFLRS